MSVLISSREANWTEESGERCRSEDCRTRRELGVDWRFGRRVRARSIWERWFTWKWESGIYSVRRGESFGPVVGVRTYAVDCFVVLSDPLAGVADELWNISPPVASKGAS